MKIEREREWSRRVSGVWDDRKSSQTKAQRSPWLFFPQHRSIVTKSERQWKLSRPRYSRVSKTKHAHLDTVSLGAGQKSSFVSSESRDTMCPPPRHRRGRFAHLPRESVRPSRHTERLRRRRKIRKERPFVVVGLATTRFVLRRRTRSGLFFLSVRGLMYRVESKSGGSTAQDTKKKTRILNSRPFSRVAPVPKFGKKGARLARETARSRGS